MRVLVACEYSGVVRDAFIAKGHDAISCDLLPTDADPSSHYQGDVFDIIDDGWDLMVAHPPCTYLCLSGVQWLHSDKPKYAHRWQEMEDAALFFKRLWDSPIPRKAIENPIMHRYGSDIIGDRQDQIVQPWMFGHQQIKTTCLWLSGLPKLIPTDNVKEAMMSLPKNERERLHYLPPGPDRWKERSRTFTGIAQAMAEQWG